MIKNYDGNNFSVDIEISENSASICGGFFGEVQVLQSELFFIRIKNVNTNEFVTISSLDVWDSVECAGGKIVFKNPSGINDITAQINAVLRTDALEWICKVDNKNEEFSVMEISYPVPVVSSKSVSAFVPTTSGRVIKNFDKNSYSENQPYPSMKYSMQYFAYYGENSGIYLGVHDEMASSKKYVCDYNYKNLTTKISYYAIGGGEAANSFDAAGKMVWQYFSGDWYDAAMIYRHFVTSSAAWLPEFGRKDTDYKYKKIPFWLMDCMPNTPQQGDNMPESLRVKGNNYPRDTWYKAAVKMRNELGVPIAYHIYNWHKIPFNINYPHFLPAKDEYYEGLKELKENNVYVMPYINALSWESRDTDYDVNFENTGKLGAVIDENGNAIGVDYPQIKPDGNTTLLMPICASYKKWHDIMEKLSHDIEATMDVEGIYFDEVSTKGYPCYSKDHSHRMGGGNWWWQEAYNMMSRIKNNSTKKGFYFSESNAECHMKSFDGFLTWDWVCDGDVPAFPAVYSGYIVMLGRSTNGKRKNDVDFFKYFTAKSLLYGQQLGWCNPDIVYKEEMLGFLKTMVSMRDRFTDVFCYGSLLRPPKISGTVADKVNEPALWYTDNVKMEQMLSGAWKNETGSSVFIFAVNVSNVVNEFELNFSPNEYLENNGTGLDNYVIKDVAPPESCIVYELSKSKDEPIKRIF